MNKKNFVLLIILAAPVLSIAQGNHTPIDVTVDTGSHTCDSIGKEKKVYKDIYAGDQRYFLNENLSTVSIFGKGSCEYSPDHANSYERKEFCVTDADGEKECSPRLVRVIVRAFADCTNNPGKIGSRISAECRFTGISKKGNPK